MSGVPNLDLALVQVPGPSVSGHRCVGRIPIIVASRPMLSRLAPGDEERGFWSRIQPSALALLFYADDVAWYECFFLGGGQGHGRDFCGRLQRVQ